MSIKSQLRWNKSSMEIAHLRNGRFPLSLLCELKIACLSMEKVFGEKGKRALTNEKKSI